MPNRSKLREDFRTEIQKNLLINNKNREFLMKNIDTLPDIVIKELLAEIKKQNKMAEKFIEIAIDKDPSIVDEMKNKSKKLKKRVTKLKEIEEKRQLDVELEKELKEI